ncbi:MAG: DNA polymerase III subunit delta [Sedimentisphaerales bacterium]|nr:DNA polymerase III subunit delta [Sedimentisphaerales bacterium]
MESLIYVIAGKEDSLVSAQYQELLDELIEPSQRTTGLFSPDPATISAAECLDELRTAPFLTDKRVVAIRQADDFISANRNSLEKYFDAPCPTGRLILTVKSWDSRTRLAKKLSKAGKLINVTQPKRWQLPQHIIEYANKTHGKKLSKDAAEVLIELVGDELTRLYNEIDKLALYTEKDKIITQKHIESLIGHNRLFNAFAVIDAITDGQTTAAVERLRNMFAEDRSSEYTVIGAFAFHFRRIFNAKALEEKGLSQEKIAKQLNIWGNREQFFARLRKITLKQIGKYIQFLAETDYAIKTGRAKAQIEMEQFVLRLAK